MDHRFFLPRPPLLPLSHPSTCLRVCVCLCVCMCWGRGFSLAHRPPCSPALPLTPDCTSTHQPPSRRTPAFYPLIARSLFVLYTSVSLLGPSNLRLKIPPFFPPVINPALPCQIASLLLEFRPSTARSSCLPAYLSVYIPLLPPCLYCISCSFFQ